MNKKNKKKKNNKNNKKRKKNKINKIKPFNKNKKKCCNLMKMKNYGSVNFVEKTI